MTDAFGLYCAACGFTAWLGAVDRPQHCPKCGHERLFAHPELFDLYLAHIDCDAFYASVEKADNPDLKDKPVIVGGGQRGVVSAACYLARKFGVRSAMPAWQARKNCPGGVFIKPRMSRYVEVSRAIRSRMLSLTPMVEPLSIDEAFLDLSGTEELHGAPPAILLSRFQAEIKRDLDITVSVGLSYNKSLAKMASDQDKPDGFFVLGRGEAKDWLANKPVSILFGVGKSALARLEAAGISTCAQLADMPLGQAKSCLGKSAERLQELAIGQDPRAVNPQSEAKSISSETTFDSDIADRAVLEAILEKQCAQVSTRMKKADLQARTVTLKLKRHNHSLLTRSVSLSQPTNKAHLMFEAARRLLQAETGPQKFYRLLGVGMDGFGAEHTPSLFSEMLEDEGKKDRLEEAIDDLSARFGGASLQSGRQFQYEHKRKDNSSRADKKSDRSKK